MNGKSEKTKPRFVLVGANGMKQSDEDFAWPPSSRLLKDHSVNEILMQTFDGLDENGGWLFIKNSALPPMKFEPIPASLPSAYCGPLWLLS